MVRPSDEKNVSQIYTQLGHPVRRAIIRVLGEEKQASFTDLKTYLKCSVGTIYYNLDQLEGLVAQNEDKKYVLTPNGLTAYRVMVEDQDKIASIETTNKQDLGRLDGFLRVFSMRGFFDYLFVSTKLSAPSALTILFYGAWIVFQAQLFPLVFVYSDKPGPLVIPPPLSLIIGWALVNIMGNVVPWLSYRRPLGEGADRLMVGSCYALLPSFVLPTVWIIFRFLGLNLDILAAQAIMLFCAGYSLYLLTTAVSLAKGIRTEKAAFVTLTILYLILAWALITRW